MQTAAEITEMLEEWEWAYPRLTPKTRKPRKARPKWYDRVNEMEDYVAPPVPGVLVSCGCPVRHHIPPTHYQKGKVVSNLERRCFICHEYRQVVA